MKQQLILICLWCLVAGLMVACGGDATEPATAVVEPTATASPSPAQPDATPINAPKNVVRVAVNPGSKPFVAKSSGAEFEGFDIDLMNAIAAAAGLQIDYVEETDFFAIFKNLGDPQFDAYDLAISQLSITPERDELVDFSQPYFKTGQAIVVRRASSLTDPAGLKKIGVQKLTTGHEQCLARFAGRQDVDQICLTYSSFDQAIQALLKGEVEAVIYDFPSVVSLVEEKPELSMLGDLFSEENYAVAVGKDRPELLAAINQGLAAVLASGEYDEICARWINVTDQCLGASPVSEPAPMPVADATVTAPPPPSPEAPASLPQTVPEIPLLPCQVAPMSSTAAGQLYTIQAGDWLSLIAEQAYGNPLDYRAIAAYTNQQCQVDSRFTCLPNPDLIEVGWIIYLPTPEEVADYWASQFVDLPPLDWSVTGDMEIGGSSTVYPLTRQMRVCFEEGGFTGNINLADPVGSLAGFEQFCKGQLDIVDASVPMDESYRQLCRANGVEPIEFQIGTDAVAVVVSRQNAFVDDVTPDELTAILSTADLWSKVRPGWPNEPVKRYYPTEQSGTYLSLAQLLFPNNLATLANAPNLIMQSEDDQALVAAIQNDPYAVGFFGFAYYANNSDTLQTLPVAGVSPRPETVDEGSYPLVRPLYIYSTARAMMDKPQVAQFINYYLSSVKNYVVGVGYFLPDEEILQESIENFNQATQ